MAVERCVTWCSHRRMEGQVGFSHRRKPLGTGALETRGDPLKALPPLCSAPWEETQELASRGPWSVDPGSLQASPFISDRNGLCGTPLPRDQGRRLLPLPTSCPHVRRGASARLCFWEPGPSPSTLAAAASHRRPGGRAAPRHRGAGLRCQRQVSAPCGCASGHLLRLRRGWHQSGNIHVPLGASNTDCQVNSTAPKRKPATNTLTRRSAGAG